MSRAYRLAVACCAALLILATGTAGAATKTQQVSDFTGAASSHAVKLTIGNIELTVGGGRSNAAYERVHGNEITVRSAHADANGTGLIIPGLADAHVSCVPPKLTDSLAALATPATLAPILDAKLGAADCAVSVANLPTARHSAGELDAAITLTQSLVGDVGAVDSVLGTVQDQLGILPADVQTTANNTISAIKQKLTSSPVLDVHVAPTAGSVLANAGGIASDSAGSAVTLNLLGGVVRIDIVVADAAAKIVDGKPVATSDVALVRVRALDITTGKSLIDQKITAPQDLSILQGTPLATSIATERGTTSTTCGGALSGYSACASGTADAVSLKMLASPLPTIGLELVHTQALAAAKIGTQRTSTDEPSLPRTGAAAAATVLGGLVLAAGALAVRRLVVR